MRVFVGPIEIAGIGAGWVEGLREAGVEAELVCAEDHPFAYSAYRRDPIAVRLWAAASRWRAAVPRDRWMSKLAAVALHRPACWFALVWAALRFDHFVFLFGRTITDTWLELIVLRLLRKRVVVVFLGSDARPAFIDGARFPANQSFDVDVATAAVARQRRIVQRLQRMADVTVSTRTTGHFLTAPFLNWFALGIPRRPQPCPLPGQDGVVRILHSPSHPVLKGTPEIHATIERLRARGLAVELVTIQDRPNADVLMALRACDLVVDQMYSDVPMAAFAAEAASLRRPVLVCGCAAEDAVAQVAPLPLPPTVYVDPEDFETTLERLVRDAPMRERVADACAEFVALHWSPHAVGQRLLRILRGDIPVEWWCRPTEVRHVVGCGIPKATARARVAALIASRGVAALQVGHNPQLERAFVRFADGSSP